MIITSITDRMQSQSGHVWLYVPKDIYYGAQALAGVVGADTIKQSTQPPRIAEEGNRNMFDSSIRHQQILQRACHPACQLPIYQCYSLMLRSIALL